MSKELNVRGRKEDMASLITKTFEECFLDDYPKEALQEWLMMGPLEDKIIPLDLYSALMKILDEMLSPGIRVWEYYEEKIKSLLQDYIENYDAEELYASI